MTRVRPLHLFLSCGEASGERYGAALARALREERPDVRLSGLGGAALADAGVDLVERSERISVMGFGEVAAALPRILDVRRTVRTAVAADDVDVLVPIDFPGFNLGLARFARRRGRRVYYVVAPQLWAWGGWRLGGLRKAVDRLGVLLPFEQAFFSSRGIPCEALGHPLSEDYDASAHACGRPERERRLRQPKAGLRIGLLPGSRRQEVLGLADLLRETVAAFAAALPDRHVDWTVSVAPGVDPRWLGPLGRAPFRLDRAPLPELLPRLDLAVVCSGTASLEAALAGVPHALVYRTSALNYAVASRLVRVDRIGLANLVLGRDVVVEHVQHDARAGAVAADLVRWTEDRARRARFDDHRTDLAARLGPPGFWSRTAGSILDLAGEEAPRG